MGILRGPRRLFRVVAFGLFAAAIATELSKPEAERTWHGKVVGVVPYDFRPPTWQRIREAYWNPESDALFSDRVFGVGWAVNLYKAKTLMEDGFRRLMATRESMPIRMSARRGASARTPEATTVEE
jgi:hypothetical protein